MNRRLGKSGFTLLEMLVASLLLGMLVSILTMVFNSSSIAWRTGKSSIAKLSTVRRQLSFCQNRADNLLPRVCLDVNNESENQKVGIAVSPWILQSSGSTFVRTRAVQAPQGTSSSDMGFQVPEFTYYNGALEDQKNARPWLKLSNLDSLKMGSAKSFTVGVLSWGPDGKKNTEDDITTWPDKVE